MSEETEVLAPENENLGEQEAVSQETESAPVESEPSEAEAEAKASEPEEGSKNKVQKRIDQLTREKYEERRAKEALEQRLKELEQSKPKPEPIKPPKYEDFDSDEAYNAANADYLATLAAEKLDSREAAKRQELEQSERLKEQAERTTKYVEKLQAEAAQYEGIMDKLNDPLFASITQQMDSELIGLIQTSEKATALTYHLATNIEDADRLSRISPVQAARELALIEARLETPKPNKISNAPDPIKPIGSNESATINPDKMTTEAWMEWRQKQRRG